MMSIFDRGSGGLMDEIRCDEKDYLIWKWHPFVSLRDPNARENAIRLGSSLRVRDGSVAVFVYKQDNGTLQDYIEGPADLILKTANLPVLASLVWLAYEGGTPFQAEVYFINLAEVVQVRFGVPYFDVYDPRFLDFGVPVAVRGTLSFRITDYRRFIKLHRLDEFDAADFSKQVRDAISRYIKAVVSNAPMDYGIPLFQIERKVSEINDGVASKVTERLGADFGVDVIGLDIADIELDRKSEAYRALMASTRDLAAQTVKAQTETNIKNLQDQQRINAQNLEETLKVQREEAQRAQRMTTESANFKTFVVEKQAEVGIAGADALGSAGTSSDIGAGDGAGLGLNPATMMAGIAIGGAVGQNIAGAMNGLMGGFGTQSSQPPSIPETEYFVAKEGVALGPFSCQQLLQMLQSGVFFSDSLVWKRGLEDWRKAIDFPELGLSESIPNCSQTPPPIPNAAKRGE